MITKLHLVNWKSFEDSTVYIDPLTFLIGTNASGKSNVLDAFQFLHLLMKGQTLEDAAAAIRGGEDWIIRKGQTWFELAVTIEKDGLEYVYEINVKRLNVGLTFVQNIIYTSAKDNKEKVFNEEDVAFDVSTNINLAVEKSLPNLDAKEVLAVVRDALKSIFVLNPDPQAMRRYSKLSKELRMDAGNIAGVHAALKPEEKEQLEDKLTKYVKPLPERDINKITAVTVGLSGTDAMLYCYEDWNPDAPVDARGMSDGTLRFTAIIVSLLTLKPGSLLIIEEVDNGLHPSRARELVKVLKEISAERQIDVLCTTHNPVLMDELGNGMIPFISFVKRDTQGNSYIQLLEDKENLAKLMASGTVGDMMKEDVL
jgi:predicted ATPase